MCAGTTPRARRSRRAGGPAGGPPPRRACRPRRPPPPPPPWRRHHRRRAGEPLLLGLLRHRRTSLGLDFVQGSDFEKLNAALPSRCDPTPVWPAAQPRHAPILAPAELARARGSSGAVFLPATRVSP